MVLNFQKDVSLLPYNTFGIDVKSKKFVRMTNLINLKTPYEHLPFRTFKSFFWIKLKLLIKKKLGSI